MHDREGRMPLSDKEGLFKLEVVHISMGSRSPLLSAFSQHSTWSTAVFRRFSSCGLLGGGRCSRMLALLTRPCCCAAFFTQVLARASRDLSCGRCQLLNERRFLFTLPMFLFPLSLFCSCRGKYFHECVYFSPTLNRPGYAQLVSGYD